MAYMAPVSISQSAHDMIEALVTAAFLADDIGSQALAARADSKINMDVEISSEELVDHARTKSLVEELEGRDDYVPDQQIEAEAVIDAIRYIRSGQLSLAASMFGRVFKDGDLARVESALR